MPLGVAIPVTQNVREMLFEREVCRLTDRIRQVVLPGKAIQRRQEFRSPGGSNLFDNHLAKTGGDQHSIDFRGGARRQQAALAVFHLPPVLQ